MQKMHKTKTNISQIQDNNCCSHKKCEKTCCDVHKQTDKNLNTNLQTKVIKKVFTNYDFKLNISIKDIICKNLIKLNSPPWIYYKSFSSKNILGIIKKLE